MDKSVIQSNIGDGEGRDRDGNNNIHYQLRERKVKTETVTAGHVSEDSIQKYKNKLRPRNDCIDYGQTIMPDPDPFLEIMKRNNMTFEQKVRRLRTKYFTWTEAYHEKYGYVSFKALLEEFLSSENPDYDLAKHLISDKFKKKLEQRIDPLDYFDIEMPAPDPFLQIIGNVELSDKEKLSRLNSVYYYYSEEFHEKYGDIDVKILLEQFRISGISDPSAPANCFGTDKTTFSFYMTKEHYKRFSGAFRDVEICRLLNDLNLEKCEKKYQELILRTFRAAKLIHPAAFKLYMRNKLQEQKIQALKLEALYKTETEKNTEKKKAGRSASVSCMSIIRRYLKIIFV